MRNQEYRINHKKVKRLMKMMGLYGLALQAEYKSFKSDMNGNLLLDKVVGKEHHTTTY